jgi:hypothetical protein
VILESWAAPLSTQSLILPVPTTPNLSILPHMNSRPQPLEDL